MSALCTAEGQLVHGNPRTRGTSLQRGAHNGSIPAASPDRAKIPPLCTAEEALAHGGFVHMAEWTWRQDCSIRTEGILASGRTNGAAEWPEENPPLGLIMARQRGLKGSLPFGLIMAW